jgi:DNA invertase Pin-like site-specific DNA recombinase
VNTEVVKTDEIVRQMHLDGFSTAEIADRLNMSRTWIKKLKNRMGISTPENKSKVDSDKIVELFNNLYDRNMICEKMGISKDAVCKILRKNGFSEKRDSDIIAVPKKKKLTFEKVIDRDTGKTYYDVTPFFLEKEGMSVWNT